ncbi:MAG: hypothetical protein V4691_10715 [Pseudomonadota bacterium]
MPFDNKFLSSIASLTGNKPTITYSHELGLEKTDVFNFFKQVISDATGGEEVIDTSGVKFSEAARKYHFDPSLPAINEEFSQSGANAKDLARFFGKKFAAFDVRYFDAAEQQKTFDNNKEKLKENPQASIAYLFQDGAFSTEEANFIEKYGYIGYEPGMKFLENLKSFLEKYRLKKHNDYTTVTKRIEATAAKFREETTKKLSSIINDGTDH